MLGFQMGGVILTCPSHGYLLLSAFATHYQPAGTWHLDLQLIGIQFHNFYTGSAAHFQIKLIRATHMGFQFTGALNLQTF